MRKLFKFSIILIVLSVILSVVMSSVTFAAAPTSQIKGLTRIKKQDYEQFFIKVGNYNKKATVTTIDKPAGFAVTINKVNFDKIYTAKFKARVKSINQKTVSIKKLKVEKNSKRKNSVKFTFVTKKKYSYEVLKVAGGVKIRFSEIIEPEPPVIENIEDKQLLNRHFVYSSKDNIGTLAVRKSKIEPLSEKCKIEISEDRKVAVISGAVLRKYQLVNFTAGDEKTVETEVGEKTTEKEEISEPEQRLIYINDGVTDSVLYSFSGGRLSEITITCADASYVHTRYDESNNMTSIEIYTPKALELKKIFLDAGHGGSDAGAVGTHKYDGVKITLKEKDINLDLTLRVNQILKDKGIVTVLTREDDTYVSLADRVKMANDSNASLFLSIHNNSYETDAARGTETYCYKKSLTTSFAFAEKIQAAMVESMSRGKLDRGVKEANFYVVKNTKMPACLAEVAFLSNPEDMKILLDEDKKQDIAVAIADAIVAQLFE